MFQHIAEGIHLERLRMADARVAGIALIVITERFAGMGEENRMAIRAPRLQQPNREVLFGNRVRVLRLLGAVQSIDFLAQHRALQRAAGVGEDEHRSFFFVENFAHGFRRAKARLG